MSFIKFGKLSATVSSHTLPAPSCFTSPLGVPNMDVGGLEGNPQVPQGLFTFPSSSFLSALQTG